MDDLELKEFYRDKGSKPKESGKSLMSCQPTYYRFNGNSINQELSKDIPGYLTEFDRISDLNLTNSVTMNSEFLFNEAEEILKELAVDVNKVCDGYGIKNISYSLPVIDYLDIPEKILNTRNDYFLYKSKYYDSNMVYRVNPNTTCKLDLVCPAEIEEPDFSEISPDIQTLNSSASDGKYYYNIFPGLNIKSNSRYDCEYGKSEDIIGSSANGSNIGGQVYKNKSSPIYVKINTKGSVKITHLGFLSGRIPVITWYKKRNEFAKKKFSRIARKPCHILDTKDSIPYVKKVEIYFRSKITKKWIFLKNVSFGQSGLSSCYHEEIIPINSNMYDIDGIETTEFKIVPTEYVDFPSIRIGVYGIVKREYKNKTKTGDNCDVVNYTISNPFTNSTKTLKHGGHWNEGRYWSIGQVTKFEKKRKLLAQIKEQLYDSE